MTSYTTCSHWRRQLQVQVQNLKRANEDADIANVLKGRSVRVTYFSELVPCQRSFHLRGTYLGNNWSHTLSFLAG